VRLVQGSHIVVKKKFDDSPRLFLPEPGQSHHLRDPLRDRLHADRHDRSTISPATRRTSRSPRSETVYLCNAASEYFSEPVRPEDIVWTYSAVRPLFDDGASKAQEATRDYVLEDRWRRRRSAGAIAQRLWRQVDHLSPPCRACAGKDRRGDRREGRPWTAKSVCRAAIFRRPATRPRWRKLKAIPIAFLEEAHARRLIRRYGTKAARLLGQGAARSRISDARFG
jgi:glycerol-3-phosphate dehydrogenase